MAATKPAAKSVVLIAMIALLDTVPFFCKQT